LHIRFTFHGESPQIKYTAKLNKTTQKKCKEPINKSTKILNFFLKISDIKKTRLAGYQNKNTQNKRDKT
jgi:hypothetical protein